jgi:hypothetical protein
MHEKGFKVFIPLTPLKWENQASKPFFFCLLLPFGVMGKTKTKEKVQFVIHTPTMTFKIYYYKPLLLLFILS